MGDVDNQDVPSAAVEGSSLKTSTERSEAVLPSNIGGEIASSTGCEDKQTAEIAPGVSIPHSPSPTCSSEVLPGSPEVETRDVANLTDHLTMNQPPIAADGDKVPAASSHDKPKARSAVWRKILLGPAGTSRERPFSKWQCDLNESNQRVIHADCERTRADEAFFRQPDVRQKMEAMLTCWCKQQGVRYKQGLNEVLAPFMYLQTEPADIAPDDDEVFACFTAFLRRFAPLFESEDFVPLQCSFVFFRRLLLYHHPDLHHFLHEREVSPEMFCTPWFLTLFASKTPLKITLQLWDRHLKRNEPSFFVFLAVAVLANAQHSVFPAERGELPEILTSLGFGNREDLERLWNAAETLHRTTPSTFAARLRRTVLGAKGQARSSAPHARESGAPAPGGQGEGKTSSAERLLERLDQEKCFFILPEELVGHCYPPRAGEVRQPWHPSPMNTWRLIILDLRPQSEFEAARLPTALSFDPVALFAAPAGPQAAIQQLLHWGQNGPTDGYLDPAKMFEALKATLGENWVCDREAHICLLGNAEPEKAMMVRKIYQVLTVGLSLRHVSVASGGFEAAVACANKQGQEIITDVPTKSPGILESQASDDGRMADGNRWGLNSLKSAAANATAAAAQALKKAAIAASTKEDVNPVPSPGVDSQSEAPEPAPREAPEPAGETAEAPQPAPQPEPVVNAVPSTIGRPGNWPADADLQCLPQPSRTEFVNASHWPCVAVAVRHPIFAKQLPSTGTHPDDVWQGCACRLWICNSRLICTLDASQQGSTDSNDTVFVLLECEVSQVQRVTAKKQASDVILFYLKDTDLASSATANGSAPEKVEKGEDVGEKVDEVEMVLYFSNGIADVRSFVKALRGNHDSKAATKNKPEQMQGSGSDTAQRVRDGFHPASRSGPSSS